MRTRLSRWARTSQRGATAVEYGLFVALISGVIIFTLLALSDPVMGLYARVRWW